MIFNEELKPNLGFNLTNNLNVCYRIVVENNGDSQSDDDYDDEDEMDNVIIKYGIISRILINSLKDCLTFEIFEYIPVGRSDFCVTNAKRKIFTQSNQTTRIDANQIINECRMIDFIDSHQEKLFALHPFAGTGLPLYYKGVL